MLSAEEKTQFAHLRDDIEQISAAASHDLRDMLREAMEHCRKLRGYTDPSGLSALAEVERCIEGTMENVAALRQYAYLAQNLERVQPVSLEGILHKARLNNATLLAEKNGRISWEGEMPAVEGRPAQLELMFTHLFANGLKFNTSPTPEVQVRFSNTGHFYDITIEDNGTGMEPEFAYLVFGLFKRAEPDGPVKGCGAGLSFAKKVAENHGGHIQLHAEPGYGCRVTITLPHVLYGIEPDAISISSRC